MKIHNPWKLLADVNISPQTVHYLQSLSIDITQVNQLELTDYEIIQQAKTENRVVLTFDKDFGEIYYFQNEILFSAIILYLKEHKPTAVNPIIKQFLLGKDPALLKNKLVILYENRMRIIDKEAKTQPLK